MFVMSEERYKKLRGVLSRRQVDLTVLMDKVHKPHNLSAVMRTCDAVGIGEVHAVWLENEYPTFHLTSAGSRKWVDIHTHKDMQSAIASLKDRGFQVLAAHFSDRSKDYRSVDYTKPTAILLGAELDGVSEDAQELVDEHVVIPMMGMVESLNVSVASSVILYEAQRQRLAAGLYEKAKLPKELFERTLFEWMYPELAEHCQKKGTPYPALDEQGDITGELPR
jgi:tRNA (guanosine-2'-O-)-methyltransferase